MSTKAMRRGMSGWIGAMVLLSLCWVAAFLGPLSWLIPLIIVVGLMGAYRRGAWICAAAILLVSPPFVFFIGGAASYAKGAPSLRFMGLPSIQSFNVDLETRCFRDGGACLIRGDEWLYIGSHNCTLRLMCASFGAPSRSYDGPYPDKLEAQKYVSGAPELKVEDFLKGRIAVGGETFEVDAAMIWTVLEDLRLFELMGASYREADSASHVQAAVFEKRCLILRMVEADPMPTTTKSHDHDMMVLFDLSNMRPFAYYPIKGNSVRRIPRVRYLPEHPG